MNIEEVRAYCLSLKGVTESFPFDETTLVFKVLGKMFALIGLEKMPLQINLKCDPERSVSLREEFDGLIIPGYHMNKTHWNALYVEKLPVRMVVDLIDHSYEVVVAKMTKKMKAQLEAQ